MGKIMTDEQKVDALSELLREVIHALEMKMYDIEDPQLSHECEVEADKFHRKMIDVLHSEDT
jgi:hypothetical protein